MAPDKEDGLQKQFANLASKPLEALFFAMEEHHEGGFEEKAKRTLPLSEYKLFVAKDIATLLDRKTRTDMRVEYNFDGFDSNQKYFYRSGPVDWKRNKQNNFSPKILEEKLGAIGSLMHFEAKDNDEANSFYWFIFDNEEKAPIKVHDFKEYLILDDEKGEIRLSIKLRKFLYSNFKLSLGQNPDFKLKFAWVQKNFPGSSVDYRLPVNVPDLKKDLKKKSDKREVKMELEQKNKKDFWKKLKDEGFVLYLYRDKEHIPLIEFK